MAQGRARETENEWLCGVNMIYFDRSRRADFEKCPRKRYWGYEYRGRGIQSVGTTHSDWALMTGIGVHAGIGNLALGLELNASLAIAQEQAGYSKLSLNEHDATAACEQVAMIEALVKCWHTAFYPQFIAEYEVLAVEREEQVELAPGVMMMVRPDMIVRRRLDGAMFTWQLKTTKRADERWQAQWPLDQMTISEVLAVEARLKDENTFDGASPAAPVVSGVIIQGLVKGDQSEWPKGSGNWTFNNPLIYAWHNESGKPQPQGNWTAKYAWNDEFGSHRLGKGWRKVAVWVDYPGGIAAWLAWLQQNDPATLQQQIVTLQPILRAPDEMERWQTSVVTSEKLIRAGREALGNFNAAEPHYGFDELFPMHTSNGNCMWPYKCACFDICHGMAQPDDSDLFKPRELNHKQEILNE